MNNNTNQNRKPQIKSNQKKSFTMSGTAIGVIIVLILIRTFFGTNTVNPNRNDDFTKKEEILNQKVETKDYVLTTGDLLIQLTNNTNIPARASLKIEFYDKKKSIVDVKDTTISGIDKQTTSYVKIPLRNIKYDTYKVFTKMSINPYTKFYTNDVKILSRTKSNRNIIIEYQNKSQKNLDYVEIGVLFYNQNNKLIAYNNMIEKDIPKNSTSQTKIYIPYNHNYEIIQYKRIETVVVNAVKLNEDEK